MLMMTFCRMGGRIGTGLDWREKKRDGERERQTERGKSRADDESSKRNKRARLVPTRRIVSDPPLEP